MSNQSELLLLDTLALAGFVSSLVRIWFQAPVFGAARERLRVWRLLPPGWRRSVGVGLTCPVCVSFKVAVVATAAVYLPLRLYGEGWVVFRALFYAAAAWSMVLLEGYEDDA